MAGTRTPRLSGYVAVLVIAIGITQLAASLLFFRTIDENTVREDHARRVAELLIVGDRVYRLNGSLISSVMSSKHLQVELAPQPWIRQSPPDEKLRMIARQINAWEPSLTEKKLNLAIRSAAGGREDLVGSMELATGVWLNFRSRDISSMWPIVLRASWMTLVTTLACLAIGLSGIRHFTRPLRRLSEAADMIGHGKQTTIREEGPIDVRNLAHAMNEMQSRIARLLEDQAKTFEAISHDLRTPLSRQKLAAELIVDPEIAEMINGDVNEMELMLHSLQQYLHAQHLQAEPEDVDLLTVLQALAAPHGEKVRLSVEEGAEVRTFLEPLLLSLDALIENACHFGTLVEVRATNARGIWIIEIEDNGPGIPIAHFDNVLAPFFRLDEARGRTTKGFGLGIPTAHRLLTRFGGAVRFSRSAQGGLVVRVEVPRA